MTNLDIEWAAKKIERKSKRISGWDEAPNYLLASWMQGDLKELLNHLISDDKDNAVDECITLATMAIMLAHNLHKG